MKVQTMAESGSCVRVQGVDVHVDGEGEETILMIHGWPDTYRLWDEPVTYLKTSYRCARFSLPGFEVDQPARAMTLESMTTLIEDIVRAISPEKAVILMLHDWGVLFGSHFMRKHPSQVSRLISIDVGDSNSRDFLSSLSVKAKLMIAGYQWWLALAHKLGRTGDRMTRFMARSLGCRAEPARIGAQQNYPYVLQWTGGFRKVRSALPHCPTLYLYGERKLFMFHSESWLRSINAMPGSEAHGMATGHWVMVNDPLGFKSRVLSWLAKGKSLG
jgi:cis-3-alkyl-4-acyloxetan-2-one decarboxylase